MISTSTLRIKYAYKYCMHIKYTYNIVIQSSLALNDYINCGKIASLHVCKCSTMMYMVCITVSLWGGLIMNRKKTFRLKNVGNQGQPLSACFSQNLLEFI